MSEEQTQLDKIAQTLEDIKTANKAKPKDTWDKLAIIGQVVAGIFLVGLGLFLTWKLNKAQANSAAQIAAAQRESAAAITTAQINAQQAMRNAQDQTSREIAIIQGGNSKDIANAQAKNTRDIADAQAKNSRDIANAQRQAQEWAQQLNLDATNRQIASAFIGNLTTRAMNYDRAALVNALDIALEPKYSMPLLLRLSRPVQIRADICRGVVHEDENLRQLATVSTAAVAMVRALRPDNISLLRRISRSGDQQDANIANAILRDDSRVLIRVSQIDDFADVFINDNQPTRFQFGREPAWQDVTDQLVPNRDNNIAVLVSNTNSEGSGVRFEVRVGAEQYDRFAARYDWSGAGPAFSIGLSLSVDSRGAFHLNGDNIQVAAQLGQQKPCPSEKKTAT